MENNQEPVTQTDEKIEDKTVTQTEDKNEDVKTFTQEEVNAMLAKERRKMPSKEDMDAFNEWKESQKTDAEKQKEILSKVDTLEKEGVSKDQVISILKKGVNADDLDYIQFKVSKMEGDFEDNLKNFLEENPKFLTSQKEERKATGTPVIGSGSSNSSNGVLDILAEKHKNIDFKN